MLPLNPWRFLSFTLTLGLACLSSAQQVILDQSHNTISGLDFEVNVQAEKLHLSNIHSEERFTILRNPVDPSRNIRVKKSNWCDPLVNVYTGYLDVDYGTKHLFFYFFESRSEPNKDDVVMWINGGPGSSSTVGLLMELGPCSIDMTETSPNGTVWNPYGWNTNANIFFLEQPVGVGFSYADNGGHVDTTEEAARNVANFLSLWFEAFPQFKGRKLHLSGESYGGRYLPVFASEVVAQNTKATKEGRETLNLQSVIIGNGNTHITELFSSKFIVQCGTVSTDIPFQDISTCVRIKTALPRCQEMLKSSCVDIFDLINCEAAVNFCNGEIESPFYLSGQNPFDITKPCLGANCYLEEDKIVELLNNPDLRKTLGVEKPGNMSTSNSTVSYYFNANLDKWRVHTGEYVVGLLERGIRILIYAGTYDWQCNWVMNHRFVNSLEWSHSEEFREMEMRNWTVEGNVAGKTKSAGRLTFATIYGAGHMVPHDKPVESLAMLQRWLRGDSL